MQFLSLLEPIINLLKSVGLLKDPKAEMELRQQLADIAARQDEAFVDYIKATTPSSDRVYVWANTLVALVRPFLAVFTPISFLVWTDRWVKVLDSLEKLGPIGIFLVMSSTVVFVMGRDGLRAIVALVSARFPGHLGAQVLSEVIPPGIPTAANGLVKPLSPYTSGTGFKREVEIELDRPSER